MLAFTQGEYRRERASRRESRSLQNLKQATKDSFRADAMFRY
jgi:hypothetical protein